MGMKRDGDVWTSHSATVRPRFKMFDSLKKLMRRGGRLDEASQAYIEGRADASSTALIRQRLAASPEEREDIESLKATVSLLRSAAPVKAPRSFALREAPAQSPAVRRTPWYMQAPAMAAAVAVMVIGVFIAGDLTGALKQSGGRDTGSESSATSLAAPAPAGGPGPTGAAALKLDQSPLAEGPTGTAAPRAAAVAPSPEPAPSGAKALAPQTPGGAAAGSADQPPASEMGAASGAEATASSAATAAPGSAAPVSTPESYQQTAQDGAISPVATGSARAPSEHVEAAGVREEGGLSLPLWQIEVGLAGAVAVLLAAWAWLRRRRAA